MNSEEYLNQTKKICTNTKPGSTSERQLFVEQTKITLPNIMQLSQSISQLSGKKNQRDVQFAQLHQLLEQQEKNKLQILGDYDFLDPDNIELLQSVHQKSKSGGIGMHFSSSYNLDRDRGEADLISDEDLESGLKAGFSSRMKGKEVDKKYSMTHRTPAMELKFASSAKKEMSASYENNKLTLPIRKKGTDLAYQIYNKPQQNVISGKNPKVMPSSPMGSSQQLREIFESKTISKNQLKQSNSYDDNKSKQSNEKKKDSKDFSQALEIQQELANMINQHVNAEPITVQQYPYSPRSNSSRFLSDSVSAFQTRASGFPSGSSRDAKMTIYSQVPNFKKEPQCSAALTSKANQLKDNAIELNLKETPGFPQKLLKELKPKILAHFFESPSKYIPLKAFNSQNQEQYSERLESLKNQTLSTTKDTARYKIIKNWFKELSLTEMSVVLTTIDRDIVRLIRAMYKTQSKFGMQGKFLAKLDRCNSQAEAERYEKISGYSLLFVRDKSNMASSVSQSQHQKFIYSKTIEKKYQACQWLISGLRFLSIKSQGESDDKNDPDGTVNAITLDPDLFSNVPFFMQLMKMIDQEFLIRDYTFQKLQQPVEGSLLTGSSNIEPQTQSQSQQRSQTSKAQKNQKSSVVQVREKAYFLLQDTHRPIYNANVNSVNEPEQQTFGQYQSQKLASGPEPDDKKCIELAQVILIIIEKGLNVQFLDFLDKIQALQQQNFFFFKMQDLATDVFSDDLKVANYWFNLPLDQKEKQLEVLNGVAKDLLKQFHESKQEFDNIKEIDEEECSSMLVDSDSDAIDLDDFNHFNVKQKNKRKIGLAKNQQAQMIQEYHEFESDNITETMIVKKKRRGRKDRTRGPNGEKSVTTSSSGAQFDSHINYCDYNPNHLRAQYIGVEEKDEEVDDIEAGGNYLFQKRRTLDNYKHKSQYECMADMVIDPIPSDSSSQKRLMDDQDENSSSNFDPEDLRPYSHHDSMFSNSHSFNYQNFQNLQKSSKHVIEEETKQCIPVFIQQQYKTPKISVLFKDERLEDLPRNDLLGPSNPENQLFMFKAEIKTKGLKAHDSFRDSLLFVKMLSACKDLEALIKDSDTIQQKKFQKSGNPPKSNLSIGDMRTMLKSQFFKKLSQFCTDSILADLLEPETAALKKTSAQSKLQKQIKSQKTEEPKQQQKPVAQVNKPYEVQKTLEGGKKKHKKKNKKKKKQQLAIHITEQADSPKEDTKIIQKKKEKLSDYAQDVSFNQTNDQDSIQNIAQELGRFVDVASGPDGDRNDATEVGTSLLESNDDSVSSSCIERFQNYTVQTQIQNDTLLDLQQRYEQLKTCEEMLNNQVCPDDVEHMLLKSKSNLYNNKLNKFDEDSDVGDDEHHEAIQKMLSSLPLNSCIIRQSDSEMRYKEERTGLLSNQIHLDKYHKETMHELELIEKRNLSPTTENLYQLDYVLEQNKTANQIVKQICKPSSSHSTLISSKEYILGYSKPGQRTLGALKTSDQKLKQEEEEKNAPPLSQLKKIHYDLLGNSKPLPDGMSARQREVVLRILQDQYKKNSEAKKVQLEQSGGGPPEEKKVIPFSNKETQETQPADDASKRKNKKNQKKKNRRAHKTNNNVNVNDTKNNSTKQSTQDQIQHKNSTNPEQPEVVDDVEEVILVEDFPSKNRKRDKSVLRNNYLVEDVPKQSRQVSIADSVSFTVLNQNVDDHVQSIDLIEKEEINDRENYVQVITSKLIQNAVQQYTESPQTTTQTTKPNQPNKNIRKKGKNKQNQEVHFQQKAKQPEKKPLTAVSGLSQLSSDAASSGNRIGVPVYCSTPILNKEPKNPASVVSFKADLSDNVKIPQRGTSKSSYGKEEKFHEQTLLELDSLFPSASKDNRNTIGSSGSNKIRSSTLSKERLSSLGNGMKNQIFDKAARLTILNAKIISQNDDVQSQKISKSRKCEPDKDLREEEHKSSLVSKNQPQNKFESKPSVQAETKLEIKEEVIIEQSKPADEDRRDVPVKLQKKQKKANKKRREEQERLNLFAFQNEETKTEDYLKKLLLSSEPVQPAEQPKIVNETEKENKVVFHIQISQKKDKKQGNQHQQQQYLPKDNSKVSLQYVPKNLSQSSLQVQNQVLPKEKSSVVQPRNKDTQHQNQQVVQLTEVNKQLHTNQKQPEQSVKQQAKIQAELVAQISQKKQEIKPLSKVAPTNPTYASFDSMFESVYGAQAISAVPVLNTEKRPNENESNDVQKKKALTTKDSQKNNQQKQQKTPQTQQPSQIQQNNKTTTTKEQKVKIETKTTEVAVKQPNESHAQDSQKPIDEQETQVKIKKKQNNRSHSAEKKQDDKKHQLKTLKLDQSDCNPKAEQQEDAKLQLKHQHHFQSKVLEVSTTQIDNTSDKSAQSSFQGANSTSQQQQKSYYQQTTRQQQNFGFIQKHQAKPQYVRSNFQTPATNLGGVLQQTTVINTQQFSQSSFQTQNLTQIAQFEANQQQRQQDTSFVKRNRGAQFPPSSQGTTVTNATPTVASNGSQTVNIQQISTQQQQSSFTLNLNISPIQQCMLVLPQTCCMKSQPNQEKNEVQYSILNANNQFITPVVNPLTHPISNTVATTSAGQAQPFIGLPNQNQQQQLFQQQQMQHYMTMLAQQQQQFMNTQTGQVPAQFGMHNFPQMFIQPQFTQTNYNPQFLRPMGFQQSPIIVPTESSVTITQKAVGTTSQEAQDDKKQSEQKSPTKKDQITIESEFLQQQMNQTKTEITKTSQTDTATSTPGKSSITSFYHVQNTPSNPQVFSQQSFNGVNRQMIPISQPQNLYNIPFVGQKPMFQQQSGVYPGQYPQQLGMIQPLETMQLSVFQFVPLHVQMQNMLNTQEQPYKRFSDFETNQIAKNFFILLGKQALKMQAKIEGRLAQIEDLKITTFKRIQQIVKQTFSDASGLDFEIYGSMATKLAIDTSDMDIAVYGVIPTEKINQSVNPRELTIIAMEQLNVRFDAIDWIKNNRVIGTASVPVIKLEIDFDKLAKTLKQKKNQNSADLKQQQEQVIKTLKIDIIFNDFSLPRTKEQFDGVLDISECQTKRCVEYIKLQIIEHQFLKPLAIVLKKYLSLKNLNNSFMGTISSYGLVLMILALLKDMSIAEPNLEKKVAENFELHLGIALTHFFQVYGESFQTQYFMINGKNEFTETTEGFQGQLNTNGSYVLHISDPCNESNNVGKQTYKFEEVQNQFNVTLQCLVVRFRDFCNQESYNFDLLNRREEIEKSLHKLQQFSNQQKNQQTPFVYSEKDDTQASDSQREDRSEQFYLFGDYDTIDNIGREQSFWQQSNPLYWQSILQKRGITQLKIDQKEALDVIAKFSKEKEKKTQTILDRIVMINTEDLTPLLHDEEEERRKIVAAFAQKAAFVLSQKKYDRQLPTELYSGSQEITDIQELLTGQHQPNMMHPGIQYYAQNMANPYNYQGHNANYYQYQNTNNNYYSQNKGYNQYYQYRNQMDHRLDNNDGQYHNYQVRHHSYNQGSYQHHQKFQQSNLQPENTQILEQHTNKRGKNQKKESEISSKKLKEQNNA